MTKRGSFKRAVRRRARDTGLPYTEALAAMQTDDPTSRMGSRWHGEQGLPAHLQRTYGIRVESITPIARHGGGVFRIDRSDGPAWVARIIGSRPLAAIHEDVAILRFLEAHDFPAERCAHQEPISEHEGQPVLVTEFVEGVPGRIDAEHEGALADLLGRMHALPGGAEVVGRGGGAFGHDPLRFGKPRQDIVAAASFLDAVERDVPMEHRRLFDELRERVARADGCDDLPEALTTSEMVGNHVRVTPDGRRVAVEFEGAGRGPRLPALAFLLEGGADASGPNHRILEAIVAAYAGHVRLEPSELERLAGAMWIRPLYFASLAFMQAVKRDEPSRIVAFARLPRDEQIDYLAAKAVDGFHAAYQAM